VIAYVADTKEKTLRDYAISRLARLLSVVIPALALTVLCDWIGRHTAGSAVYDPYAGSWPIVRILAALFFACELWFVSISTLSNGPFWSLGYEFWYYALFAAYVYLPSRWRWRAVVVLCLIVGPKILLLFPLWLLGVGLYHARAMRRMPQAVAAVLFVSTPLALVAFHTLGGIDYLNDVTKSLIGGPAYRILEYSKPALSDLLTGLLVFVNFAAMQTLAPAIKVRDPIARVIRWTASFTFSIYLFHVPLLKMFAAVLYGRLAPPAADVSAIALALVGILLLGTFSENRKTDVRKWLMSAVVRIPRLDRSTPVIET
jgi:peptidoglycan/LPS O-acetylase OafA/YrhL